MTPTIPKCGHTKLDLTCSHCKRFQKNWYKQLETEGFKDIEYGLDNPALIYQPVDIDAVNPIQTAYYDSVWAIYHKWVKEGRSLRDQTVAELLAKQEGETGTVRGIMAYLKEHKLSPYGNNQVQRTIKEINKLVKKLK